ncbi:AraC family transcriptional regulator [Sphingomonas sp. SRS2]|uniref:AraC family transcriptional regulator n=1 Tax=Sphingomonas sp. SRS2 TaxID=133190 RepID=UPI0022863CA8|nr:AraC family transcriptional regulator [Sphingomonas sp. SRS2]
MDACKIPPAFWRALEHVGLRPAPVLRLAGLPATLHLNPYARITTAQLFAFWKAVEVLAADAGFFHKFVNAFDTTGHQPAFLAASFAADYRDGLNRIDRFKRLSSSERFRHEEREGEFLVYKDWPFAVEPEPAISIELSFAFFVKLGRMGTGRHLTPARVEFALPKTDRDEHRSYFGCEIIYDAPRNLIVLRAEDLDRPFPGHNPEFLDLLTPALAASVKEIEAKASVSEQVKIVLRKTLASGRPDLADVAQDLGTSERTLQRRITEEGKTFRALLVEARQEVGRELLSDPSVEVEEVACLLGYQDTSSFYRAFREWEGVTPNRWRTLNHISRYNVAGPQPRFSTHLS